MMFGQYLKRSEEDIAEAIDIYRSLGNDTFYGPEEEPTAEPQEQQDQWIPGLYNSDAYYGTVQTHIEQTHQQGTAVHDTRSTETSITVLG